MQYRQEPQEILADDMTRRLPQGRYCVVHRGKRGFEHQCLIVTEGGQERSSLLVGLIVNRHRKAVGSILVLLQ